MRKQTWLPWKYHFELEQGNYLEKSGWRARLNF